MSENEITIKSNSDGTFNVNTAPGRNHHASIVQDGGATRVEFGRPEVAQAPKPVQGQTFMGQQAGTMFIDDNGGSRFEGVQEFKNDRLEGFDGSALSSITDLAGRKVNDLSLVRKNPENFKAVIGGTEATVQSLIRAGVLRVTGSGDLIESTEQRMHMVNPRDRSNPLYEEPKRVEPMLMANIVRDFLDQDIRKAGLSPADVYAQAIGNGESAAKTLADAMGNGTDYREIQQDLIDTAKQTVADGAVMMERAGMVDKGHGALVLDYALNQCSKDVAKRILHGVMLGSKAAFQEAVHRWLTREQF